MKRCNNCATVVDDAAMACTSCGGDQFAPVEPVNQQTVPQGYSVPNAAQTVASSASTVPPQGGPEPMQYRYDIPAYQQPMPQAAQSVEMGNGNIAAGVVGALLFSIIGVGIYFGIYQLGIIAGISGLIMFVLASFGYSIFAGTKNRASVACLITSIAVTVVMLFAAQYMCFAFEVYKEFKEFGATFIEAFKVLPEFLTDSEIALAFFGDLGFAYLFGAVGIVSNIVDSRKKRLK